MSGLLRHGNNLLKLSLLLLLVFSCRSRQLDPGKNRKPMAVKLRFSEIRVMPSDLSGGAGVLVVRTAGQMFFFRAPQGEGRPGKGTSREMGSVQDTRFIGSEQINYSGMTITSREFPVMKHGWEQSLNVCGSEDAAMEIIFYRRKLRVGLTEADSAAADCPRFPQGKPENADELWRLFSENSENPDLIRVYRGEIRPDLSIEDTDFYR